MGQKNFCFNDEKGQNTMSAKVYFSKNITPQTVLELYKMVGKEFEVLFENLSLKAENERLKKLINGDD